MCMFLIFVVVIIGLGCVACFFDRIFGLRFFWNITFHVVPFPRQTKHYELPTGYINGVLINTSLGITFDFSFFRG